MNAEKLYFLAKELQNEFKNFEIVSAIKYVVDILEDWNKKILSDYGTSDFKDTAKSIYGKQRIKEQIDEVLREALVYLDNSRFNNHSGFIYEGIKEISIANYIGSNLRKK